MSVKLYTVPRVKIAKVGDWPVEKGYGRFTETDIQSMATWAERTMKPRLKIGHVKTGPGALPVWGQTANHTAEIDPDDGVLTLYADYVNVPQKLAEELPTRLPGRSVEAVRNRRMPDGTVAPMVPLAVALLGDREPSMSTLGDHPTIEGLHETVVVEDDLAVHAARLFDEMESAELVAVLEAGRDSVGDETPTEDAIVPAENPKATEDPKPNAAPIVPATPTEAPKTTPSENPAQEPATPAAEPAAASKPKLVEVDASVLEAMQAEIEELKNAREAEVAAGRASLLDECEADHRISEDSRPAWEAYLAADPVEASRKLEALPKWNGGPVHAERGHQGDPDKLDSLTDEDVDKVYDARYGKGN